MMIDDRASESVKQLPIYRFLFLCILLGLQKQIQQQQKQNINKCFFMKGQGMGKSFEMKR